MSTMGPQAAGAGKHSRLAVMNFLNEVGADFPQAISFASGRPADAFFRLEDWLAAVPRYIDHFAQSQGLTNAAATALLAQYGRTAGIINALVATQLGKDEGLVCAPEQVLITAGCQEALSLCLAALCREDGDVILARNPTYIGVTGIADLAGMELAPLLDLGPDDWADSLRATVAMLKARGKRPRVLYLIPEFDNPTGEVMPLADRERGARDLRRARHRRTGRQPLRHVPLRRSATAAARGDGSPRLRGLSGHLFEDAVPGGTAGLRRAAVDALRGCRRGTCGCMQTCPSAKASSPSTPAS